MICVMIGEYFVWLLDVLKGSNELNVCCCVWELCGMIDQGIDFCELEK